MEAQDLERVPETYRTPENQELFDSYENFDSFVGDLLDKNGKVSTLSTELDAAKKGLEGTIRIPGEDATDEEKAIYRKAIGVPETVDQYGIDGYKDIPGGEAYMKAMLNAGLTPTQAKDQLAAMAGVQKEADKKIQETQNAALAAYRTSLGDKADETFAMAQHGIDNFFKEEGVKEKVSKEIMANPELIKTYAKMGAIIKEKPMILSLGGGGNQSGNIYESMKGLE